MNGLALCAGGGGLELGLRLALGDGYRCVAYVEREAYAAATLVARMQDASLDEAPVWDDLATFDGRPWSGVVDLVTAGFPCQPWSNAGQRRGTDDDRWLWPDIARILGDIRPSYVFLENVSELALRGGLGEVLGDLAALGFDAEWDCISAASVGAPHGRDRLFILAHALRLSGGERPGRERILDSNPELADASGGRFDPSLRGLQAGQSNPLGCSEAVGDSNGPGLAQREGESEPGPLAPSWSAGSAMGDADGERRDQTECGESPLSRPFPPGRESWDEWREVLASRPDLEPAVRRVADGAARRVDRLRVIGNGIVPLAVAVAIIALAARIIAHNREAA